MAENWVQRLDCCLRRKREFGLDSNWGRCWVEVMVTCWYLERCWVEAMALHLEWLRVEAMALHLEWLRV